MNFLAHYHLATRFLTPPEARAAYTVGTALPDLLPLATPHKRLRLAALIATPQTTSQEQALTEGVRTHLLTDAAFHKTEAFLEAQSRVGEVITGTPFVGIRVRRFFLAHILTELALDAVMLHRQPNLADDFYRDFTGADYHRVAHWAEATVGQPLPNLPGVLARFASARYLESYSQDAGVAEGLRRISLRAKQDAFRGENSRLLAGIVTRAVALLEDRAESLMAETAAAVRALSERASEPTEESHESTVKPGSMQQTRKFQLHYPLERLTEPIVTRLVTEYDLAPNLLGADVDASKGGWLIVELTGEEARMDAALQWLRAQGLVVQETD